MKRIRGTLCLFLIIALLVSVTPVYALGAVAEPTDTRGIHNTVHIDDDPAGGYQGDYVVIYNPDLASTSSRYTGNLSGLIQTSVGSNGIAAAQRCGDEARPYKIDIDPLLAQAAGEDAPTGITEPILAGESYSVGSVRSFSVNAYYSPTGSSSVQFKCLYVGQHCYIWTPTSTAGNVYPLDGIDSGFAKLAADEFDSKLGLMQSSFGNHSNGSAGDGKLHMLYYNIDDGWQPGQGYIAGFFSSGDYYNNGLPILNIDTYPGVFYQESNGTTHKRMDDTYSTMVHEYQHLINFSNTSGMSTWLNECFSAAAEEICYPGSSVVNRIQSWENYYYGYDWLNPPSEFAYQPSFQLHNGYSLYDWDNNLGDVLALYAQVSFFAQYLYSRFGNSIYKQISNSWKNSQNETTAITSATGVSCSELAKCFRVALTANATQNQYNGIYGFKVQSGYDPANYHNVQNPWSLLAPIVFTGSGCSVKGGGSITVKPVNGVYYPPVDADSGLQYIGVRVSSAFTVTAVPNDSSMGSVSVDDYVITAFPAADCFVAGCDVIAGSADTGMNGNEIAVHPYSDCTIRVNFARKANHTVRYVVCGRNAGSQSARTNDQITLPSSVSVNLNDWSFRGWVEQQLPNETVEAPRFYAPGASYTVPGDVTLYALFSREESGGVIAYRLVNDDQANWAGNYVITYGTDPNMYLLKGLTVSSDGVEIETTENAVPYGQAGVSLQGDVLHQVTAPYLFTMVGRGSYYSLQNRSTGVYLGVSSNSGLAGFNTYVSGSCDWTPGIDANASSMQSATYCDYPFLDFSTSYSLFWTNGVINTSIRFWKEFEENTVYYTTSPVEEHVHTPGDPVTENNVAPTCTQSGSYDSVVYCTGCGEELSRETVITEPRGHKYFPVVTRPTCTEGGYTTYICFRCNDKYIDSYTDPRGHTYNAVVTPPTCTGEGFTTYTCTRCGDSRTGDPTEPLGHDYEAVLTPPACTAGGFYTYTCTRCGDSYTEEDGSIPTWHSWDDGVVTVQPTEDEDGELLYTCTRCGETRAEPIPRLNRTNPFVDVPDDSYFCEPVLWAYYHTPRITSGTDATHFSPQAPCTREQIVFFLWAVAGKPSPGENASGFSDVRGTDYFYGAVLWAQEQGITCGISETRFGTGRFCSREQALTLLWRAAGSPEPEGTEMPFRDVPADSYAAKAILWAAEQQITSGTGNDAFSPKQLCTRGEIVTFLAKTFRAEAE